MSLLPGGSRVSVDSELLQASSPELLRKTGSDLSEHEFCDAEDDPNFLSPKSMPEALVGECFGEPSPLPAAEGQCLRQTVSEDQHQEGGAAAAPAPSTAEGEGIAAPLESSAALEHLSSTGAPHDEGGDGVREEDAQQVMAEEEEEEREAAEQANKTHPLLCSCLPPFFPISALWLCSRLLALVCVCCDRPPRSPKQRRRASSSSRTSRRVN